MKTAEEKAKEYALKMYPILDERYDKHLPQSDFRASNEEAYMEGYNEAMRWRDANEELPEGGVLVQIKFDDPSYKGHPYSHDVYFSGYSRWNVEHRKDVKVTHWRPIE